jgi:hypothetical protein
MNAKRVTFQIEITEDHHQVHLTKRLLKELGEDVAGAVSAHDSVEGNAVECLVSSDVTPAAGRKVRGSA